MGLYKSIHKNNQRSQFLTAPQVHLPTKVIKDNSIPWHCQGSLWHPGAWNPAEARKHTLAGPAGKSEPTLHKGPSKALPGFLSEKDSPGCSKTILNTKLKYVLFGMKAEPFGVQSR